MNALFLNPAFDDHVRRQKLYDGQLVTYSANAEARAFVAFARELIEAAFAPHDPQTAQFYYPVADYAAVLAALKPTFIHHPRAKQLVRDLLSALGCDLDETYFDVPRLRSSTSDDYLTSGIAYAFHPHRDTWYSAPHSQLNWWLPVYEVEADNVMALHPPYWNRPVQNSSRAYNYQRWNAESRHNAAQHIGQDTRVQPRAEEPIQLDPQVRVVAEPGGLLLFSAAHLHSSVPNTSGKTRFSIDFRTVHLDDVRRNHGAPNADAACTGTNLRDFLRGRDFAPFPEELAAHYDGDIPVGELVPAHA